MSLGNKIREFESLPEQTLKEFNRVFLNIAVLEAESLHLANESFEQASAREDIKAAAKWKAEIVRIESKEVEIGEICGPENVRKVYTDGVESLVAFNILVGLPEPHHVGDFKSGDRIFMNKCSAGINTVTTNANTVNEVMQEKEMELEPVEYMVLQYLRGCSSPYHTQIEIAAKLKRSIRGLRNVLREMENKEIIKVGTIVNAHRIVININEEWL